MQEENNLQSGDLKEKILSRIKSGDIHMKSKAHFIFRVVLIIIVVILILLVSAFILSYVLFSLRTSGRFSLLGFGTRGVIDFLIGFPWLILIADCILLLILDHLLKNFKFGYHSPKIYLFLGTFVFILAVGYVIELTPIHGIILRLAEERQLPGFNGFYGGIRKSHSTTGIFRGKVISIEGDTFMLNYNDSDLDQDDITVYVHQPKDSNVLSSLKVNDTVFVAGTLVDGEIQAYGLQKLPSD